jgi:hypothetical protein
MAGYRADGKWTRLFWTLIGPAVWVAILVLVGTSEAGGVPNGRQKGSQGFSEQSQHAPVPAVGVIINHEGYRSYAFDPSR